MNSKKEKEKPTGTKYLIIVLILLIIVAGALLFMKITGTKVTDVSTNANQEENNLQENQEEEKPKTFASKARPIAVMIDNHINAMPQAGLLEADLVYEMIVEGGETRLMLVLQDKDLERVGPIRSSRHDFLDYAMENDAIYVHYGWSPQAREDISTLGINNINGIFESATAFWRDDEKYAPHNAVTSTENILNIASREGYRTTYEIEPVLNYVTKEITLEDGEDAMIVEIPYSTSNTAKYVYDPMEKEYVRYSRDKKQVDWNSGETVTTKNIIITLAKNTSMDSYGRQNIENVGTLDGYYITNGKAIKIKGEKLSRQEQTTYYDLDGNEIEVNDGKTFIQICPIDAKIRIKASGDE